MSTYEFYEFQAVDRALTPAEQAELRGLSSRADITSSRLCVVYNWGSFKGDPDRLMERYFDAFVYVANWGTREFQLRLPRSLFDPAQAEPYLNEETLSLRTTREHVLLTFRVNREDEADWEDGTGWLASLLTLRAELLAGDLRALYIAWLASVDVPGGGEEDEGEAEGEDALEPPVPSGLGSCSGALDALAGFLFVSKDLLAVAAQASPAPASESVPKRALAEWLASLPATEKDSLLLRVVQGPEPLLGAELLRRFRQSRPPSRSPLAAAPRTVGQLRAAAEEHRTGRKRRQARKAAQARARELEALAARESQAWREVEGLFATRRSTDHAKGVQLLVDLRDLARHRGSLDEFHRKLGLIREENTRRQGLMRRMKEAGLGVL
jgi:hypothetical protein